MILHPRQISHADCLASINERIKISMRIRSVLAQCVADSRPLLSLMGKERPRQTRQIERDRRVRAAA